MRRTRTFGNYRLVANQRDFHPYLVSGVKSNRRGSALAQPPNVLLEIGSVAAVLHEAGLLTDCDVMRQFQEFAAGILNSRTKDPGGLIPNRLMQLQTSSAAMS